jgi:hypothetical protein
LRRLTTHLRRASSRCGSLTPSVGPRWRFDDPTLVSVGGPVPVLALAESAGLRDLAGEHLTVPTDNGANAGLKVTSLVGGMVAGAESIDDMALLRHGGKGRVSARVYAPSALGSFLRAFTFGHVPQLDAITRCRGVAAKLVRRVSQANRWCRSPRIGSRRLNQGSAGPHARRAGAGPRVYGAGPTQAGIPRTVPRPRKGCSCSPMNPAPTAASHSSTTRGSGTSADVP